MKRLLTFLFVLIANLGWGQNKFVPGYFVSKDGARTECQVLLKKPGKRDNPISFEYRLTGSTESKAADLGSLMEVGVNDGEKFRYATVDIDRTPDDVNKLKEGRNPEFASEILFLRILTAGKATLFQYDDSNLHRFFFSMDNGEIRQLVYKRFISKNHRVDRMDPKYGAPEVSENEDYKQELLNALKCPDITMKEIANLTYTKGKLTKTFARYNKCQGNE